MHIRTICAGVALTLAAGSPALADDFCANLKTALAAERTGFTSIPGPPDDVIPGWRDAKLTIPGSEDCNVETDKRDLSYLCSWKKEQPAALTATYKYVVKRADQCLTGFQKTAEDRFTTWRNPAVGTVTVDGRLVMNKATNAVMLKVKW